MADRLWSLAVRDDWAHKCAVCNGTPVEAHHLIPRQNEQWRYDLRNGIALCARHHQFEPGVSPHQNAAGWMEWLTEWHPNLAAWYREHSRVPFTGTKTALYYCDILRELRQYIDDESWEAVVGIKFGRYLLEGVSDVD